MNIIMTRRLNSARLEENSMNKLKLSTFIYQAGKLMTLKYVKRERELSRPIQRVIKYTG